MIEAEEIRLDRWTVVFRPLSEESDGVDAGKGGGFSGMQPGEDNAQVTCSRISSTLRRSARITGDTAVSAAMRKAGCRSSKKNPSVNLKQCTEMIELSKMYLTFQIFVMNNYFGIGLDADLCYAFHTQVCIVVFYTVFNKTTKDC